MSHFLFTVRLWAEKSRELKWMSGMCTVAGRGKLGWKEGEEKMGGEMVVG